mgnify:CR=1 FL=1
MTHIVYRWEDDDGNGPWRSKKRDMMPDVLEDHLHSLDALPGPFRYGEPLYNREDRLSFSLRRFKCGCSSLEQLSLWFPTSVVGELIAFGFKLVKYTLRKVFPGNTQVCWLPSMVVSKAPTGYGVEDLRAL